MDSEDTAFCRGVILEQQNAAKRKFTQDRFEHHVNSHDIDISLDVNHRQNLILIERLNSTNLINLISRKTVVIVDNKQ